MAYDVKKKPKSHTSESYTNSSGTADAREEYTIVTDSPAFDNAETVKIFAPIPRLGDVHPNNAAKVCNSVDVEQTGPCSYEAVIGYSVPLGPGGNNLRPTDQPPDIKWSSITTTEPVDVNADGKPICTVMAEGFDPKVQRPFSDRVLTVTCNVVGFDQSQAFDYEWTVNSDTFYGFPPGTALITKIEADFIIPSKGQTYWRRSMAIQFRRPYPSFGPNKVPAEKAWYWRQIAEGYYIIDQNLGVGNGGLPQGQFIGSNSLGLICRAVDYSAEPTIKPVYHSIKTGYQISDPAKVEYYLFKIYDSKPFSVINVLGR